MDTDLPLSDFRRELRLFLSVDIVGSTAYKARTAKVDPLLWSQFFDNFFNQFHNAFQANLTKLIDRPLSYLPSLWKLQGDEILYSAPISSPYDAYALVWAFLRTVYEYDADMVNQELRLKGTAWTAGFPIRNFELRSRTLAGGTVTQTDYIGLDIDAGFRISTLSRPGRLVVSFDLADILTREYEQKTNLCYHHVGWAPLKGIADNTPYPVIWVSERGKIPRQLPWQEYICEFTAKFNEPHSENDTKYIQQLCSSIRDALPSLEMFGPYFSEDEMPEQHRKLWTIEKARIKRAEKENVLQLDEPMGTPSEITTDDKTKN